MRTYCYLPDLMLPMHLATDFDGFLLRGQERERSSPLLAISYGS